MVLEPIAIFAVASNKFHTHNLKESGHEHGKRHTKTTDHRLYNMATLQDEIGYIERSICRSRFKVEA